MRLRIRGKYALTIIVLIIVTVGSLAGTLFNQSQTTLEYMARLNSEAMAASMSAEVQQQGIKVTLMLADKLSAPLHSSDLNSIHALLNTFSRQGSFNNASVYDPNGVIVHDGQAANPLFGHTISDPGSITAVREERLVIDNSGDTLRLAYPIMFRDQAIGGVYVTLSLADIQSRIRTFQQGMDNLNKQAMHQRLSSLVFITLLLMGAGIVTATLIARNFSRPILQLAALAESIGRGQTLPNLPIKRHDELGELTDAMLRMLGELRNTTVSRDFLDHIIDSMNDGVIVTDQNGAITLVNQAITRILGHSAESLHLRPLLSLFPGTATEDLVHGSAQSLCEFDCHCNSNSGETRHVSVSIADLQQLNGKQGQVCVIRDITERHAADERLRQAAVVFDNTTEGVMMTSPSGVITSVNRAFCSITGYRNEEVIGKTPALLNSGRHDPVFYAAMWSAIANTGYWQGEIWNRRKNGEVYPEWLNISPVYDEHNQVNQYVAVFSDITSVKESQTQLQHLVHHDPLTQLPNRLLLNARLTHALQHAQHEERHVAILFVDIDRFKTVNDTLGHPVGDQVLLQVAERLSQMVRTEDTLARLGGDEFIMLLDDLPDLGVAGVIAQKIVENLIQPFRVEQQELYLSASVGISVYPRDGGDPATLIKHADIAMFRAKGKGKNNYQYFNEEFTRVAQERMLLENHLRRALANNELELYFQPQTSLDTGHFIGAEVLLRWHHPEMGDIPPTKFIPIAEDAGLIEQIGDWTLYHACLQAVQWQQEGLPPLQIAVNLSGHQLNNDALINTVSGILNRTGLKPDQLELEVTESVLMQHMDSAAMLLGELKEMGVSLAIDDFGTGYSSLNYLKRLPIHKLKIDRSFVQDIPGDPDSVAIVHAIITLGHNLQLKVIAEGVETEQQRHWLRYGKCDEIQGRIIGMPVSADAFVNLWEQNMLERDTERLA